MFVNSRQGRRETDGIKEADSKRYFQPEESGGTDLRSAEEKQISGVIQSQFFLLVTHMHASAHTKTVCIYSHLPAPHRYVRVSVCNPFLHFLLKTDYSGGRRYLPPQRETQ